MRIGNLAKGEVWRIKFSGRNLSRRSDWPSQLGAKIEAISSRRSWWSSLEAQSGFILEVSVHVWMRVQVDRDEIDSDSDDLI